MLAINIWFASVIDSAFPFSFFILNLYKKLLKMIWQYLIVNRA